MFKIYVKSTSSSAYSDITDYVTRDSLKITDQIQEKNNTCRFEMESNPVTGGQEVKIFDVTDLVSTSSLTTCSVSNIYKDVNKFRVGTELWLGVNTATEEKVIITAVDIASKLVTFSTASVTHSMGSLTGIKKFAGHILRVSDSNQHQLSNLTYEIEGVDYTKEFDRVQVNDSWTNTSSKAIICSFVRDFVNTGLTSIFTTASIETGVTFTKFKSAYKNPVELMQRIADQNGNYAWWIDYDKRIHFQAFETSYAPIGISTSSNNFSDLRISSDFSQIKNRQVILGGVEDGSTVNEFNKGDGTKREWVLRSKFSNLAIFTATSSGSWTTESVLPDNLYEETAAKYFGNYSMQSVRSASTTSTMTTGTIIRFQYTEKVPINVIDEDPSSITALKALGFGDGVVEGRPITDKSIDSRAEAEDRARAELLKFSNTILNASFATEQQGLKAGQMITINDPYRNVNQAFLIQKVQEKVYTGENSKFSVDCASTLFGINELILKLLRIGDKIEADTDVQIDLLKLLRENISLTASITRVLDEESSITGTVSLTSSITAQNQTPPFEYGAGGNPQGRYNLSQYS